MKRIMSSGYMTRSKALTPHVQHDVNSRQFFIDLGTTRAFLSYKKSDKIIIMEHTEVPANYTGKGFGNLLAKVRWRVYGIYLFLLTLIWFFSM